MLGLVEKQGVCTDLELSGHHESLPALTLLKIFQVLLNLRYAALLV